MYVYLYTLLDLTRHEICISTCVATLTIHARKKYIVNEHIICICPGITCIVLLMEVISCNKLTFPDDVQVELLVELMCSVVNQNAPSSMGQLALIV